MVAQAVALLGFMTSSTAVSFVAQRVGRPSTGETGKMGTLLISFDIKGVTNSLPRACAGRRFTSRRDRVVRTRS
jgi:hypothetical protein